MRNIIFNIPLHTSAVSVTQSVERLSRDPEVAGSISNRAFEVAFFATISACVLKSIYFPKTSLHKGITRWREHMHFIFD